MHIKCCRCRLNGRQPVMIILRMETADMANRGGPSGHVKPVLARSYFVFLGIGPAIGSRNQLHPVRPEHMQLKRSSAFSNHRFKTPIPA